MLRHVGIVGRAQGRLLSMSRISSTEALVLFNCIKKVLEDAVPDVNNLVCQSYDGSSSVRGHLISLQKRITDLVMRAIYV